jgi:predicted  nucleic acid-binding Zn-ribbon protein
MATLEELTRRVEALEAKQDRTTDDIAAIKRDMRKMALVQDDMLEGVDELRRRVAVVELEVKGLREELRREVGAVRAEQAALRRDLPGMMAETMREVLREQRGD